MKVLIGLMNQMKLLFKCSSKEEEVSTSIEVEPTIKIEKDKYIGGIDPYKVSEKEKIEEKTEKEKCEQKIPSYNRGGIEELLSAQLLKAQLQEQELKNDLIKEKLFIEKSKRVEANDLKVVMEEIPNTHPYCSISLYLGVITIIWNDSSVLRCPNISIEKFDKIRECVTEEEVLKIIDEKDNN